MDFATWLEDYERIRRASSVAGRLYFELPQHRKPTSAEKVETGREIADRIRERDNETKRRSRRRATGEQWGRTTADEPVSE